MNSNTNIAEYLKLCAKRMSVLLLLLAIVFPVVLIAARISTPVQYTITGKIRIQSDVMGESIADQYNISELSLSAALTSITLIDNSNTVQHALEDSRMSRTIDPAQFVSMGKSTPFEGWKVYGKCVKNEVRGNIVYEDERMNE